MKRTSNIIWGIVLIAVGVIFALNALDIAHIDVFFKGWWTLFIIVPCAVGLLCDREKPGNLIGLLIGVALLLASRGVFSFDMIWKLAVPVVIVIIGLKLIWKGASGKESAKIINTLKADGEGLKEAFSAFSGQNISFDGEVFNGASLTAVFGGIKCDLRGAIIEKDAVIETCSVFGGIDISVQSGVNVKISSNSLFGGVSDKTFKNNDENSPTIYISSFCMFGGVDVK